MTRKYPKFATKRIVQAVAAGGMALVLAACGAGNLSSSNGGGGNSTTWKPYAAKAADSVPTVDVKFGMRPYADNTFYQIAIKKGWFKDVGINLVGGQQAAEGISVTEEQWTNLLLQGSTDISSSTCGYVITTYNDSQEMKCIQHAVTFYGQVMFANPKLGLKSVEDYVKEGKDFKTAVHDALEPLTKGDDVYINPGTGELLFTQEPFKYAGLKLPNFKPTPDSDMFTQAQAGKINFLHPGGAPIAVELLKLGWKPIYNTKMLVDYGPKDASSPFTGLVLNNGIAATAKYASAHEDTILRFVSVMYRIAAETEKDTSLFDIQAPYLNSVAGTNLTGKEIADEFTEMHPLETFEKATEYYDEPSSGTYYKTVGNAQIKAQEDAGAIPKGFTADNFIWAPKIYRDLANFKKQYEAIAASAGSSADKALLAKAKQYYDTYDYLDAYQFALKATGK
jgi:ABC-type nitrate/sulfonate/bicarbonate transport system substrate-binding protein